MRRFLQQLQRTTKRLEARVGIEPTHKGFADLSLTTWVPRPAPYVSVPAGKSPSAENWLATKNLERETGFEPATSTLARSHSTTELLPLDRKIIRIYAALRPSRLAHAECGLAYANSSSIFFAARSRFTMRKLRTCPVRTGSTFGGPPDPVFHFACSIELNDDTSDFNSLGASAFGAAAVDLQVA